MKQLIQPIDRLIEVSTETFNNLVVYIGDEDLSDVFDSDSNGDMEEVAGFVDGLGAYAVELEHASSDLQDVWIDVYPGENQSIKHDELGEILNIALSCVDMVVEELNKIDEEYNASPRADLEDVKLPMPTILENLQNVIKVLEAVKNDIA